MTNKPTPAGYRYRSNPDNPWTVTGAFVSSTHGIFEIEALYPESYVHNLEAENAALVKGQQMPAREMYAPWMPIRAGCSTARSPAPVSVGEAAKDEAAFAVAKAVYNQSEGFWEPSIQQSYRILEAALHAIAGKGEG